MARVLRILVGAGERLVVCGDFTDVPTSKALDPLLGTDGKSLGLVNVLAAHQVDPQARWTITHKQTGEDRQFDQYDYLLVPPAMAKKVTKAWVERRKTTAVEPDGSDHDPVFCELAA